MMLQLKLQYFWRAIILSTTLIIYSLTGRFQEAGETALGEWQGEGKKINVGKSRLHPGAWGLLPQGLPENCTEFFHQWAGVRSIYPSSLT